MQVDDTALIVAAVLVVGAVSVPGRIRTLRRERLGPRPAFRSPGLDWALGGGASVLATILSVDSRPRLWAVLVPLGVVAVGSFAAAPLLRSRDLAERAADPWTTVRLTRSGVAAIACYGVALASLIPMLALGALRHTWQTVLLFLAAWAVQRVLAWCWVQRRPTPAPSDGSGTVGGPTGAD